MPWYRYDKVITSTHRAVKYQFGDHSQWIPYHFIKKAGEGVKDNEEDGVILIQSQWAKVYMCHLETFKSKAPLGGGWKFF
ncbi:MAG: hypothetical protein WC600_18575 [Desulfobaccales bacterium]